MIRARYDIRDEGVLAEHDDDGVAVEKELVVRVDGLLGVLAVQLVGSIDAKLATVLLGELDKALEAVRVGVVVVC